MGGMISVVFNATGQLLIIQGDPREPDIFKINSTQLFFK